MDGRRGRRESKRSVRLRTAVLALTAASIGAALLPGAASATEHGYTYRIPISVSGYQVKQTVTFGQRPPVNGHVTHMEVDIVDAACQNATTCPDATPVPIQRLMLHHIVFLNTGRTDQSCGAAGEKILGFDNMTLAPPVERFYAAGEERAKLAMPAGYGYPLGDPATSNWAVLYMVMNHKPDLDSAYIQYKVTVDDDPAVEDAKPVWLDERNCSADPIYNVPGTGEKGATDVQSREFTVSPDLLGASGGRIISGAGHVHGGAHELNLTQPSCGNRELFNSEPTWGRKDHPFYNVRPILHEPGPISMTAFQTPTGFPFQAGEPLRLNSIYDNTRPHTRVMGIMIVYVAPDDEAGAEPCGPLPTDVSYTGRPDGRTKGPPHFEVPLTGLDENGDAITIDHPEGELRDLDSGDTIGVKDNLFTKRNIRIDAGDKLNWSYDSSNLHNLTLANGPKAIGGPNLSRDGSGEPRVFTKRFKRPGTYRLFCALHPVQMTERVVVRDR